MRGGTLATQLAGLMFLLVLFGGLVNSASGQERGLKALILTPGPLMLAHADEENNCEACHSGLDKRAQDGLCLDCHEAVAADRKNGAGLHSRLQNARYNHCNACHVDHRGRDFVSVALDPDTFDHAVTDFELRGRHRDARCVSCHEEGSAFRAAPSECHACHAEVSPHGDALGEACADCHGAEGWQAGSRFDHGGTQFPLRGAHADLACASCHAGERYTFDSLECVDCHKVRDVHLGVFGTRCDTCHGEQSWDEASFDHGAETGFALRGAHARQQCATCHHDTQQELPNDPQCATCHAGVDVHAGRYGRDCSSCHGNERWDMRDFDHAREADWPLPQGHDDLSCGQCHHGSLEDELERSCGGCHRDDDVHRSSTPVDCATCHSPLKWRDTPGFNHELTRFPLEGMHGVAPCIACHADHRFANTPSACDACHLADDAHDGRLGAACDSCHTPNGWSLWQFDHGKQTDFSLDGVHADIACTGCHRQAGDTPPASCGGCHAADDRHQGAFGRQCDTCHKGTTFGDFTWQR